MMAHSVVSHVLRALLFMMVMTLFPFHPQIHGQRVGDVMPIYNSSSSEFYIYYLRDIWDDPTNQRHPWHALTTTDFDTYNEMGESIGCSSDPCKQDFAIGTGSVIKQGSTYYGFYTGHNPNYPSGCVTKKEGIMLATSLDPSASFTKSTSFTTIYAPTGQGFDEQDNFRDPYVFLDGSTYYMLVSARKNVSGTWRGVIAKYTSTNLTSWTYAGVLYDGAPTNFFMMECAQIFKMGSTYYLLFSDIDTKNVYYKKSSSVNGPWSNPVGSSTITGVGYAPRTASNGTHTYIWGWEVVGTTWAGQLLDNQITQDTNGDLVVSPISGNVSVTGVSVNPTSVGITVGSTTQLSSSIIPSNATNQTVSWSSSNSSICTVNSSGLVTGVAAGTASVTVTTQDGGFTAVCLVTVTAPAGIVVGGTYKILVRHSGKAMDASGASNGAKIQQWDYLGGSNQKWIVSEPQAGYYTLTSESNGKVVDAAGTANGSKIQIWQSLLGDNQKWQITSLGNGYYKIIGKASGRAIAVKGATQGNGVELELRTFSSTKMEQQWNFVLLSGGARELLPDQKHSSPELSIYPNPVSDQFSIDLTSFVGDGEVQVEIIDLTGRKIQSLFLDPENHSFSAKEIGMIPGIYVIRVKYQNHFLDSKIVVR